MKEPEITISFRISFALDLKLPENRARSKITQRVNWQTRFCVDASKLVFVARLKAWN